MASKFSFFKPQYNSNNLTGVVGGTISSELLSGYLGELFVATEAPPEESEDTYYQYRKIFLKNTWTTTSTSTRCWLDAEQHPGQISIALETGSFNSVANATIEPSGITLWANPTTYADGLNIGTLAANAYTGVWLRQSLYNISEPDNFASLRFYIGGIDE